MADKSSTKILSHIAEVNGAKIVFDEASDNTYMDCEITKKDVKLYVIFTNFHGIYYAYGLNSAIAPSELYLDLKTTEPDVLKTREEEIFGNVERLLQKEVTYHENPSFFNKQRGYIELQVDGKVVRLPQKSNVLKLPKV